MFSAKYPIGKFEYSGQAFMEDIQIWIQEIEQLPEQVKNLALSLSTKKLNTPYRDGGWTGRQVVNHIADSHLNSICRFKLALTEDNPTIKPYEEARWAELPDYSGSLEPALNLLQAIHTKWVILLKQLNPADFERTFHHPESGKDWDLYKTTALYAWHGKHHLGHLQILRNMDV